ncbi:ABC transporter permease [Calycomorphotria hydatis]|uniref:Transport permease protein n=1 Tax=Calycomorphotria hydatis TaxID=2528027 RepID=A0A517T4J3_9PLAN|nr:ABC transporter permease [Calycomorphotria hydatis]QDT63297.1 Teichoic acid translocation permease protein TagG [Calycomorphotria hydatis]
MSPLTHQSPETSATSVAEESKVHTSLVVDAPSVAVTTIEPHATFRAIDWKELYAYRDLLWFLTWRNIKVRYAQSALGIGWALIQPLFQMVVFTIVFGKLAGIESEGVDYALFSFVALVPWTYFSNALIDGVDSLISNGAMLGKIYFPRLVLPFSTVLAKLLDFAIAMVVCLLLLIWYQVGITWSVCIIPLLTILMVMTATGASCWLTALAIQYRDVKYAMNFLVQLFMYAAPVVYPTSLIPEQYQVYYALNPMVGIIEGFRASLLGTLEMPWTFILTGSVTSSLLLISGIYYYRSREKLFADVA